MSTTFYIKWIRPLAFLKSLYKLNQPGLIGKSVFWFVARLLDNWTFVLRNMTPKPRGKSKTRRPQTSKRTKIYCSEKTDMIGKQSNTQGIYITEKHVWTCNLCDYSCKMNSRKSLTAKPWKHIRACHPDKADKVQQTVTRVIQDLVEAFGPGMVWTYWTDMLQKKERAATSTLALHLGDVSRNANRRSFPKGKPPAILKEAAIFRTINLHIETSQVGRIIKGGHFAI